MKNTESIFWFSFELYYWNKIFTLSNSGQYMCYILVSIGVDGEMVVGQEVVGYKIELVSNLATRWKCNHTNKKDAIDRTDGTVTLSILFTKTYSRLMVGNTLLNGGN